MLNKEYDQLLKQFSLEVKSCASKNKENYNTGCD